MNAKSASTKQSFGLRHVQVEYEGVTYSGTGVARWDPADGITIESVMSKRAGSHPPVMQFFTPRFKTQPYQSTIRCRLVDGDKAVIHHGGLRNQIGLVHDGYLTVKSTRFTRWRKSQHPLTTPSGCVYFTDKLPLLLPDQIKQTTQINGRTVNEAWKHGLDHNDDGYQLSITPGDDDTFTAWWSVPKQMPRLQVNNWPYGLCRAFHLFGGISVRPVGSELNIGRRLALVMDQHVEPVRLGNLGFVISDNLASSLELCSAARFFTDGSTESNVASKLMMQCFDAMNEVTWHTTMFLIGSALEATLRTLFGVPFDPLRRSHFSVNDLLHKLRERYFNVAWETEMTTVHEVYTRLRHRSAHPDWISGPSGAFSDLERAQSFNDMVYLTKFYGYLIRAMAKLPNLLPKFPAPVEQWKGPVTMSTAKSSSQ